MIYHSFDHLTHARLWLSINEKQIKHSFFDLNFKPVLSLVWNRGPDQNIYLDGSLYVLPTESFACLAFNQNYRFESSENLVVWQFDKPFYCIETYDHEVGVIGFLFWGQTDFVSISLHPSEVADFELLLHFFIEELKHTDLVQQEMLRALLKRLIVKLNTIARRGLVPPQFSDTDLNIVRQFNLLVEKHFRRLHAVSEYGDLLNRSPKTLSNVFLNYKSKSPLRIIHERLALEAKRLLIYTDKPVKEIAIELGFQELSHFSRFFKGELGTSPTTYRKQDVTSMADLAIVPN